MSQMLVDSHQNFFSIRRLEKNSREFRGEIGRIVLFKGKTKWPDYFRKTACVRRDDNTSAGHALQGDDTKWLRQARWDNEYPMSIQ